MILDCTFVLDRSGSMASTKVETEGGLNALLEKQRAEAKNVNVLVSLVTFDNSIEDVFIAKPITDIPRIECHPRGMTALYDAVGQTITKMGERFLKDPQPNRKVVLVILTDGGENASQKYSAAQIAEMFKHQREKYNWDVVFIGAGEEAYREGAKHFNYAGTAYINNTGTARAAALNMLSHTMSTGLASMTKGVIPVNDSFNYTEDQRQKLATVK